MLGREQVYKFMHRLAYSDEQTEQYVSKFMDFYDRSPILNNVRRECIEEFLPVFIAIYELGIFSNQDKVMAIRRLAMDIPA